MLRMIWKQANIKGNTEIKINSLKYHFQNFLMHDKTICSPKILVVFNSFNGLQTNLSGKYALNRANSIFDINITPHHVQIENEI